MVSFMISNLLSGTANATPVSLEQHATHRLHEHWQNLADLALSSRFHSKNRMTENGEWSWGLDVSNGYACSSHPSCTKACFFHKNDAFCKNGANRRDERRELSRKAKKKTWQNAWAATYKTSEGKVGRNDAQKTLSQFKFQRIVVGRRCTCCLIWHPAFCLREALPCPDAVPYVDLNWDKPGALEEPLLLSGSWPGWYRRKSGTWCFTETMLTVALNAFHFYTVFTVLVSCWRDSILKPDSVRCDGWFTQEKWVCAGESGLCVRTCFILMGSNHVPTKGESKPSSLVWWQCRFGICEGTVEDENSVAREMHDMVCLVQGATPCQRYQWELASGTIRCQPYQRTQTAQVAFQLFPLPSAAGHDDSATLAALLRCQVHAGWRYQEVPRRLRLETMFSPFLVMSCVRWRIAWSCQSRTLIVPTQSKKTVAHIKLTSISDCRCHVIVVVAPEFSAGQIIFSGVLLGWDWTATESESHEVTGSDRKWQHRQDVSGEMLCTPEKTYKSDPHQLKHVSPHWRVGFLFLVLYPRLLLLLPVLLRSLTHSLTHPLTHSLTHSLTHAHHSLIDTHSLTHTHHSMCTAKGSDVRRAPLRLRGRRGTMCTAKGSDVRPSGSASFAWQAWDTVHCQGVGCTPWRASGSASFAWQAWDTVHCQGVGCTPWRPSDSASFGWQTWDTVHCQGVGCTPWRPSGSASFAWQAWDTVHCQGVGCTPWRPSGSASFEWQAWDTVHCQGVGCTPWHPSGSASFVWQAWDNVHCQRVGCTPWRPSGSASFAWQAWDTVHCQGVGCTPSLPRGRMYTLASLGLRFFCVAGVGHCALPRGRMYALACIGLRLFWVADVGHCALPRGRMYALASLRLRFFCVAGVGHCPLPRGRGSDVRPGIPRAPLRLCGRRGTMCTAKGSDVRPGVPRAPPLPASSEVAATQCDEEIWAVVCSAAVSRRLVLKRVADFPSSACLGKLGCSEARHGHFST